MLGGSDAFAWTRSQRLVRKNDRSDVIQSSAREDFKRDSGKKWPGRDETGFPWKDRQKSDVEAATPKEHRNVSFRTVRKHGAGIIDPPIAGFSLGW